MKIWLSLLFLFVTHTFMAQNIDQKVIDHLGETKASELYTSNRAKYDHLLHYINYSWYTQDVSFKDLSNIKDIRSVNYTGPSINTFDNGDNFNLTNFNPLLYDIKIQANYATTYKLGETGKIIVFYSRDYYVEKYKIDKR